MKNLFNNPWFIGALAAFAAIYLGVSLAGPIFGGADDEVDAGLSEIPFFGTDEVPAAAKPTGGRELAVDKRGEISWLHDVERDPFAGTLVGGETETSEQAELPRVAALFVGDGVRAAVLNDRLVRVGDEVGRYRVTGIDAYHVLVTRGGRSYRLEPDA